MNFWSSLTFYQSSIGLSHPTFAVTRLWDLVMFSIINFHLLEENSIAKRNGDKNWENQKSSTFRFQDGR